MCCCQRVVATLEISTQTCFDDDVPNTEETTPIINNENNQVVKNVLTQQPKPQEHEKEWDMC